MSDTEKIIEHEHKIKTLEHRVDKIDESVMQINKLCISIEKIAMVQTQMLEEQKQQRKDINLLKEQPAKDAREVKQKVLIGVITSIVSIIVGALLALIIK